MGEEKNRLEFTSSDVEEIVSIFQDATQSYREDKKFGYVRVEHIEIDEKDEREKVLRKKLISIIGELKERFSYRDIAILTRDNDSVELITGWLLEKNIPVESDKTLNIRKNAFIKEIVSLLKFLNSPLDNLSFASFILGEIFLKVSKLNKSKIEDFIFNWKLSDSETTYLYRKFQSVFPEIWDAYIDEFFKSVGFVPLYELVISIFGRFKVMENFPEYQGFFMKFLELIKEQEEEYQDITSFLEFFEKAPDDDLYVDFAETESVKVLTIHKAKGLEFSVVIIPFLSMNIKVGIGEWRKPYVIYPEDSFLTLLRLKKKYGEFSKILNKAYREERKKSFIDELNSIYVAFTRAKNELYVFVPTKENSKSSNLVCSLIPWKNLEMGEKITYPEKEKKGFYLKKMPSSEYRDWIHLLKDEFIDENRIRNRENILKGEILHYILSWIGNIYNQDRESVIRNALEETCLKFPFIEDYREFASIVKRLIENEVCKKFFYVEKGEVYTEKEIVDSFGHTRRIDRLIVKEDEVWVIDYKSSKEEREYSQQQIREYIHLLKEIYPESKIKGFLIYLDDISVEEVE